MIGDVDPAGSETVETIKRDGGEATFVRTDVSVEGDVKNLIATAVKTYGGLHCAFNNAGVLPPTVTLVEMEESIFDQDVGCRSERSVSVHEARDHAHAAKRRRRNCEYASIAGLIAEPGISAYIAAKHGVIGLSKAAAVEYASKGIRINALAPGLVNTAMTKAWFDDPNMSAYFTREHADRPCLTAGRNSWHGFISLFRPRLVHGWPDVRDRWRLHDSLT